MLLLTENHFLFLRRTDRMKKWWGAATKRQVVTLLQNDNTILRHDGYDEKDLEIDLEEVRPKYISKITFDNILEIRPETKFGENTRFDFLIIHKKYKAFIEVKNVTLSRDKKIAEFPDAITSRGLKHINELIKANKKGYKIVILFLIQRNDCKFFKIAEDIDPKYSDSLSKAVKKKLNVLCFDCKFSPKGIKVNKKIKFKI